MNRLFRDEAAEYIKCGTSTLDRMRREGLMEGTYYTFGKRPVYITERLDEWMENGGEEGAKRRLEAQKSCRMWVAK